MQELNAVLSTGSPRYLMVHRLALRCALTHDINNKPGSSGGSPASDRHLERKGCPSPNSVHGFQ